MKISGPPNQGLFEALAGAKIASDFIPTIRDIYRNNQAQNAQGFTNAALASGRPVTEMPGGFFRRALSKTGLVSPNIEASPGEMNQENLALQQQQTKNIAALAPIVNLRKTMGPTAFKDMMSAPAGRPVIDALTRAGIPPDSFAQETPAEAKVREANARADANQQRLKDEFADKKAHEQFEETNANKRLGIENAHLGIAEKSLGVAEEGLDLRKKADARAEAAFAGETPISGWNKTTFVGPDLKPFRGNSEIRTVADARAAGYTEIAGSDKGTLAAINSATDDLSTLRTLAPKFLVNTAGMNTLAAQHAIKANAMRWAFSTDPDYVRFKSLIDSNKPLISTTYALQHRYPSQVELKTAGTLLPHIMSDSLESGTAKLDGLDTSLRKGYQLKPSGGGTVERTSSVPTSATAPILGPDGMVAGYRLKDGSIMWEEGHDPHAR